MSRNLTGLRVLIHADGGLIYGVARVKYNRGHQHAGNYEIETRDGTSLLAPYDECAPGENWDVTPEEGRFAGSEFFLPSFIDDTRRAFLTADHGVMIPGNMQRLGELADKVRPGWQVQYYSHGCNEFRGSFTVGDPLAKRNGFALVKPKGANKAPAPLAFTWPTDGIETGPQYAHEFDVTGDSLHIVRIPAARTGKHPSRSLSLTFSRLAA